MMKRTFLAVVMAAVLGLAGSAHAASIIGGYTDVTFDAGAAGLFQSVTPSGTATQNGLTFRFPITPGISTAPPNDPLLLYHNGSGLDLTNSSNQVLNLGNFLINGPCGPSITVCGNVNGGSAWADLFTVVPSNGVLRLALTNTSATALNGFLGITSLTAGLEIATANPQPTVPEPATMLLMGTALGFAALRRRKR